MGRDHTLFALVEGHVKFTRVARPTMPLQKGKKRKPWRKFVNVVQIPTTKKLILSNVLYPRQSRMQSDIH